MFSDFHKLGCSAVTTAALLLQSTVIPHARASDAMITDRNLSPTALVASLDGATLYVACATAGQVVVFDTASQKVVRTIGVPDSPIGLTLTPNAKRLYVTCAAPESTVCIVET